MENPARTEALSRARFTPHENDRCREYGRLARCKPLKLYPIVCVLLVACGLSLQRIHSHASRETLSLTHPKIFVVDVLRSRCYFEDWIRPLLFTLSTSRHIVRLDQHSALKKNFESGDIVLLVNQDFGLQRKPNVDYWYLNTEGPDKKLAETAISKGFLQIIDYCLANVQRLLALGAETVLWLPIIVRPSVSIVLPRTHLCMVGVTHTPSRLQLWTELKQAAISSSMSISFHEPRGWGSNRDFDSQKCALVVNVASRTNNPMVTRIRFDVLWQYDIPIISEMTHAADIPEYEGTLHFVERHEIVQATLAMWHRIHARNSTKMLEQNNERYRARLKVQRRREEQFRKVARRILRLQDEKFEDFTISTLVHAFSPVP